jgi:hypothetical protein
MHRRCRVGPRHWVEGGKDWTIRSKPRLVRRATHRARFVPGTFSRATGLSRRRAAPRRVRVSLPLLRAFSLSPWLPKPGADNPGFHVGPPGPVASRSLSRSLLCAVPRHRRGCRPRCRLCRLPGSVSLLAALLLLFSFRKYR